MKNMPKRFKHRKVQKGKIRGEATRGHTVEFGEWGLQSMEAGWLTARVLEAGRVAANRAAPGSRITIRVFPHKPVTGRPPETRMGKGKGPVEGWVAVIRPGMVLFEIAGVTESQAREALRLGAAKLPIKTRVVTRIS